MFRRFLSFLREKLFQINDSPHKISLGFGLGIFAGLFPGTGPLAALFLAFIFRANRAAAIVGSMLTNTWLSFMIFAVSLRFGSFLIGADFPAIHRQAWELLSHFRWNKIFSEATWPILKPLFVGFFASGLILGLLGYLVCLGVIVWQRNLKQKFR